jgi:hypothetical protein
MCLSVALTESAERVARSTCKLVTALELLLVLKCASLLARQRDPLAALPTSSAVKVCLLILSAAPYLCRAETRCWLQAAA